MADPRDVGSSERHTFSPLVEELQRSDLLTATPSSRERILWLTFDLGEQDKRTAALNRHGRDRGDT
jgi:hypothetical protein